MAPQSLTDQGFLVFDASRLQSVKEQRSLGLLRMIDQPVTENSTRLHTTFT
jgi:hypothetical protein